MFILTDGKNFVMENPMKQGTYISTTSPVQAKEFSFKQARSLLNDRSKKMSWIKAFHMVNQDTGEACELSKKYKDMLPEQIYARLVNADFYRR